MKITIVTKNLAAGGAERVIVQLLNEWCEEHTCNLILLNKDTDFYHVDSRVHIQRIGRLSQNPLVDKLKKYMEVRRLAMASRPDVILSMPEEIGIYVIGALLGTGVPVVVSERNNPWVMPNKKATRVLRRMLYPFADGLIFQTKGAKSFFPKRIQKKGIVLPNPLDLSRIPEPYTGERKKRIVSVGRLEPQKNFKLLIEAFDLFWQNHKDYELVIYGEGKRREELEALIASKTSGPNIRLPGRSNDVLNEIRDASAFVMSSDYEGVPNALLEAMALGLPCISTDCAPGGARALIQNGVNGFLVPVGAKDEIAEKMNIVASEPFAMHKFSSEAQKVQMLYDAKYVAQRWNAYLSDFAK